MRLTVNERQMHAEPGETAFSLRDRVKPGADIVIVNGFAASPSTPLADGDTIALIRRGEVPSTDEFEAVMVARHTPGVHGRVRDATVGIAGLGGLGSAVAVALARVGLGRLVLADFDVVEPSNLNRQCYFADQIGMRKTEALADTLARVNPCVAVEAHTIEVTPGNVGALFARVDVMVEALDAAERKAMLVTSFLAEVADVPVVAASGLAGADGANSVRTRRAGSRLWLVGDETAEASTGTGLMSPRVGVAAHHQANAVLRLLLGADPES
ncbi:MAG: sulfur carrier protein ThiS adenylyltransferase ThiF [Actinobacteria bacterium]|nr:MAG: sulfur carrier protein ThiS adenylyltransferase ThiF [Actinomycetota bacterium]